MFHLPFALCPLSSLRSCFSFCSKLAVRSSGEDKVPERKGKQKDTLYLAFNALPYIYKWSKSDI